jgi:hypothetical protein
MINAENKALKQPKMVKCKACGTLFTRVRPMQKACSVSCAVDLSKISAAKAEAKQKKAERRQDKAKLDAMRTLPQLVKVAQSAFNAYVRARDAGKGCISCGNQLPIDAIGGAFDCGHYRSVGSSPHLRFDERNAHGQCKHCNRYLSGNHVEYRKGLIGRIGQENLESLECDQEARKYSKNELMALADDYRRRAREVKRQGSQEVGTVGGYL